MCRNIRPLFNFEPPATPEEVQAAAIQYVRKVSGIRLPTANNRSVFERAVRRVARATQELVDGLETRAAPKDRDEQAAKARARSRERYAQYSHTGRTE